MAGAPLELLVLGPLEGRVGSRRLELRARKQRALLASLVVRLGEVVSGDRLVDDLWGAEPPATARHALQVYVSELRKALPEGTLVTHPSGYRLELAPAQVDSLRFERLVVEGRQALAAKEPARVAEMLREALALWRGAALADFAYEPFAQAEIARLEELRRDAIELRIEADLALGRDDLVAELEALVAAEPLRERLRAQLMLALYRAGRQADALAAYRDARETLVEELGIEPGPELRELEAAILRQDATLSLAAPAVPPPTQRKLATILFADLVESTSLAVSLDPEALRDLLGSYFDAVSAAVARHSGTVEKFIGDAVMAVFGTPVAHEDDALRAARAALEIRDAVAALREGVATRFAVGLEVRVGIATGEILAGGVLPGGPLATGPAVALAARLEQTAAPGTIVADALTRQLTAAAATYEDLGELALRGLREPVRTHGLVAVAADAPVCSRRLDAPLVGRRRELAALTAATAAVLRDRTLRTVALLGPAGIGKSRLARELAEGFEADATVLTGRCLSYGAGSAFAPLREPVGSREAVLAALAGDPDVEAVADRLEAVLDPAAAAPADEVPWAFRRYCEALAAQRPLLLVLDDLHWAEPGLLDVVEHLAARSSGVPILLVCVAREELGEIRPELLASVGVVALEPLSDEETDALVDHLLPDSALARETRERIVAAAEGNPLFLEQLAAHAAETGTLEPPPTLRALLASRLDRLGPGERGVLERAAVVGREPAAEDVTTLLDAVTAPTAATHLETLVRRGFLHAVDGDRFRFGHGLIHDAVYRATPKELRAELHERYADALAANEADDETVGYHLERAYVLRVDLGSVERRTQRLAEDAAARLGTAGLRALRRNDVGAGSKLVQRVTALQPAEAIPRVLLCEHAVALATAGDAEGAERTLTAVADAAHAAGDRPVELRARVELAARRLLTEPEGAADAFLAVTTEALPVFEQLGDDRALGRTWMLTAWLRGGIHCRHASSAVAAERALHHYRRSGWPASACLAQLCAALFNGPTPVEEAIARCEDLLREVEDLAGEANVRAFLGALEAMRGRFDEALALIAEARLLFDDLGHAPAVARKCGPLAAFVYLLADEVAAAESNLRETCEFLRNVGDRGGLASEAASLADVLYRQMRYDECECWTQTAEENAASDDIDAQLAVRSVRARLHARSGRHAEAETLASEAVRLGERTDALNQRAETLLALAEVLRLGGRDGADAATESAVRLFDLKGNSVAAAKSRQLLATPVHT